MNFEDIIKNIETKYKALRDEGRLLYKLHKSKEAAFAANQLSNAPDDILEKSRLEDLEALKNLKDRDEMLKQMKKNYWTLVHYKKEEEDKYFNHDCYDLEKYQP